MANISKKITLAAVQQLQIGQTIRDIEIKGFGIRKRGQNASYFLQTRINGRLRWITIGLHGSPWNPSTARKEALRLLNDIASGIDPSLERQKKRSVSTLAEAAQKFLEDHGPKIGSATFRDYSRLIRDYLIPAFGNLKVNEIDKSLVSKAHNSWADKPRNANHALAVLSKLMSWAEEQGLRPDNSNPCRGIKKYRENKRERYLSHEELERLGDVLNEAEETGAENLYVIAAIRLLILTGARLSEILTLTWQEVDLERGLLFLKHSKTGQKTIFLNEAAKDILSNLPRLTKNPYVIIGHKTGEHLVNLRKPWTRIRSQAGLEDVRLHDLRHSFASLAAGSGASLPLIGGLLGHTQPQTTARYAHLANNPLREVNERVGAQISDFLKLKRVKH
ncbi:MAG: tyrosine-type recombinase/integrase [Pseudomonadota bacterium]